MKSINSYLRRQIDIARCSPLSAALGVILAVAVAHLTGLALLIVGELKGSPVFYTILIAILIGYAFYLYLSIPPKQEQHDRDL